MKLQEIIEIWKNDSKVDSLDLTAESQKIYDLHAKYLDLYTGERLTMKAIEMNIKKLKLDKHEYYLQGPSRESKEKGWDYPTSGKILRQDISLYLDADKEIQKETVKLEMAIAKVDALKAIMDMITYRGQTIGNMIKREIWMGGN